MNRSLLFFIGAVLLALAGYVLQGVFAYIYIVFALALLAVWLLTSVMIWWTRRPHPEDEAFDQVPYVDRDGNQR